MSTSIANIVTYRDGYLAEPCVDYQKSIYPSDGCQDPGLNPHVLSYMLHLMNMTANVVAGHGENIQGKGFVGGIYAGLKDQSIFTVTVYFGLLESRVKDFFWSWPIKTSHDGFVIKRPQQGIGQSAAGLFQVFENDVWYGMLSVFVSSILLVILVRFLVVKRERSTPHRVPLNSFFSVADGHAVDEEFYEYNKLPYSQKITLLFVGLFMIIMVPIFEGFLLVKMSSTEGTVPFDSPGTLAASITGSGYELYTDEDGLGVVYGRRVKAGKDEFQQLREAFVSKNWLIETVTETETAFEFPANRPDKKEDEVPELEDQYQTIDRIAAKDRTKKSAIEDISNGNNLFLFNEDGDVAEYVNEYCSNVMFVADTTTSTNLNAFLLKRNVDLTYLFISTMIKEQEALQTMKSTYKKVLEECSSGTTAVLLNVTHFAFPLGGLIIVGVVCLIAILIEWILLWSEGKEASAGLKGKMRRPFSNKNETVVVRQTYVRNMPPRRARSMERPPATPETDTTWSSKNSNDWSTENTSVKRRVRRPQRVRPPEPPYPATAENAWGVNAGWGGSSNNYNVWS